MSYLCVTKESVHLLRSLADRVAELHKNLLAEANNLQNCYDENHTGLGFHSSQILDLLEELELEAQNVGAVKELARFLRLDAKIREDHINGPFGIPAAPEQHSDQSDAARVQSYLADVLGSIYTKGYRAMRQPNAHGTWSGNIFHPNLDHIPAKSNPDKKTFHQIAEDLRHDYGFRFKGVPFVSGYADFSSIALARVDLADVVLMHVQEGRATDFISGGEPDFDQIYSERARNMRYADQIALRNGLTIPGVNTATDLEKWREQHRFTWDESHLNGYLLVPSVIHNNIPHTGLVGIGSHGTETEQKIADKWKKRFPESAEDPF